MSEEEESENTFIYDDQPWNPVSYFEEEDEATGGNPSGAAYSPSRLASLFESNKLAIDQDIAIQKRLSTQQDTGCSLVAGDNEDTDLDSLSQYTLEVDNGIKILDTTPAINQKAIFHDLDRLRRWRESVDNNPSKDVYINDEVSGSYLYEVSNDAPHGSDDNIKDLNMDYILNSLPDITNLDSDDTNVNCFGKLHELENQLNVDDDGTFTLGTTNSGIINTSVILDKKNSVSGDESDLIINKIILNDVLNEEYSIQNISDLNRKNSENDSSNINNMTVKDINDENLNNDDSSKDLDISEELDNLFDDSDDDIELPDVPEYLIDISSENEGLTLTDGDDFSNNTNVDHQNNTSSIINDNNHLNVGSNVTDDTGEVTATLSNNCENISSVGFDSVDDNGNYAVDFNVEDIISSNETDVVDALIDCAEDITSCDTNTVEAIDDCNNSLEKELCNSNKIDTNENRTMLDKDNDSLAIEEILDHIEDTENCGMVSEPISENKTNMNDTESNNVEYIEVHEETEPILPAVEDPSLSGLPDGNSKNNGESSTSTTTTFDSRNNSFNSDDNTPVDHSTKDDEHLGPDISNQSNQSPVVMDHSSNESMPIPKTVAVSSVHYKDSIGCLTPDDEEDEIVASCSGYAANNNNKNSQTEGEPSPSTICNEKEYESDSDDINFNSSNDVHIEEKSMESDTCTTPMDLDSNENNKASDTVSTDDTDIINPVSAESTNIVNVDITTVDCQSNVDTGDRLEHELVAASDSDPQVVHSHVSEDSSENQASSSPVEASVQDNVGNISNTEANSDNPDTNDSVFSEDSPVPTSSNTVIAQDTNDSNDSNELTSDVVQELRRPSGSVRRVRFSIDNEEPPDDQEGVPPSASAASYTEQNIAPSLPQGIEGPPIPMVTPEMRTLGWIAPKWIPDSDAKVCMTCNSKFTVVKRRHHCRACGKVLCSQCCNMKFHLPYMDYKPVRVCQTCCDIMINALNGGAQGDQMQPPTPQQPLQPTPAAPANFSLPEAPPPYSETADGVTERLGSTSSIAPPYSESALPRFDEQPAEVLTAGQALENLPVMRNSPFPTTPINDMMSFQLPGYSSSTSRRASRNRSESEMSAVIMFNSTVTNLPPILRRDNEETRIINNPDLEILMKQMNDEKEDPIAFIVNKNLVVRVKAVDMDCCVEKKCWCFVSDGMGASNQEEVVIVIKQNSYDIEELSLLRKVLQQMNAIFEKAKHGNAVSDSEQMEFAPNVACMPKNTGMLFYKPTVQCLKKLFLPTSPYLFGMYIERSEIPWAKNFPLRLLLRIGAEYKYYPCPLFNVLDRPAVYEGVGRTILDLLADFRNFQYTLPRIVGVSINLRGKDTILKLPRHRFDEVLKAVNAAEENVLSLAGNFSPTCDGHLVSVEKDGRYKTQTLSIVLKENRKVTCASFFVMSAALKPDQSGIKAKASIVEDGVMVQVTSDVIQEFKTAIKEMKEYSITAGNPNSEDASQVGIEWCSADSADRPKLTSPIDAKPFDNLTNMKIRHSYDYTSNNLTAKIHWVEVYFLPQDNDTAVQRLSARELGQMTSSIAKACMSALSPHLMTLIALEMTRIGLRVNLAANFVEYKIGANLTTLPAELLPTLDDKLVPAVHNVMSSAQERVAVELIFQLVKIV